MRNALGVTRWGWTVMMSPGDVRVFQRGRRIALVMGMGVWAKRRGDWIDIHVTGTEKFHTTVTNQPDSKLEATPYGTRPLAVW